MPSAYPLTIDQISGTAFITNAEWPEILRCEGVNLRSSFRAAKAISGIAADYLESFQAAIHLGDIVTDADFYSDPDETEMWPHLDQLIDPEQTRVMQLAKLACEELRGVFGHGVASANALPCGYEHLRPFDYCGHRVFGNLHIEVQYPVWSERIPGISRQFIYLDLCELDAKGFQLKRELAGALAEQAYGLRSWNVWVLNVPSGDFDLAKRHDNDYSLAIGRHIEQLNITSQIAGLRRSLA